MEWKVRGFWRTKTRVIVHWQIDGYYIFWLCNGCNSELDEFVACVLNCVKIILNVYFVLKWSCPADGMSKSNN